MKRTPKTKVSRTVESIFANSKTPNNSSSITYESMGIPQTSTFLKMDIIDRAENLVQDMYSCEKELREEIAATEERVIRLKDVLHAMLRDVNMVRKQS